MDNETLALFMHKSTPITDTVLKTLHKMEQLHALVRAESKDGRRPRSDEEIQRVNLTATAVTDVGLKELAGLTELTTLNLNSTKVTDAGLKELKNFKALVYLSLWNTQITDTGLKTLESIKGLLGLMPYNTNVTKAGLDEFQKALPNCKIY